MSVESDSVDLADFDTYAAEYDHALEIGLRYSGESSAYFVHGRLLALADRLRELGERPRVMLDFGCGTGGSTALLNELVGAERAIGVDVSTRSLSIASAREVRDEVEFHSATRPVVEEIDCAYCNGVFHHIRPGKRDQAIAYVFSALRPGGLFALCENNPWNPGTRLVMRSIPFDRGAMPLRAHETRRLLRNGGFEVLCTDFLFLFPQVLRAMRPIERHLQRLPLGAQYMVLARKPVRDGDDDRGR
jgi:SAM-dependent methyltransferase